MVKSFKSKDSSPHCVLCFVFLFVCLLGETWKNIYLLYLSKSDKTSTVTWNSCSNAEGNDGLAQRAAVVSRAQEPNLEAESQG